MTTVRRGLQGAGAALALALFAAGAANAQSVADRLNDYPTAARADYIFACMATNGQSRQVLEQCACSIDEIASILTYEDYVAAETILTLRQTSGERMAIFKSDPGMSEIVAELRRAQAEAEIVCF